MRACHAIVLSPCDPKCLADSSAQTLRRSTEGLSKEHRTRSQGVGATRKWTIVLSRQRLEALFRGDVVDYGRVPVRLPDADLTPFLDALSAEVQRRDDVRDAFAIVIRRISEKTGCRRPT